jgi:hypothetical protein
MDHGEHFGNRQVDMTLVRTHTSLTLLPHLLALIQLLTHVRPATACTH